MNLSFVRKTFNTIILITTLSNSYELTIHGVGGEISSPYLSDVGDTKGYYGVGSQFAFLQKYFGEYTQLNIGYVHNSFWIETQIGAFIGRDLKYVYPRIGIGASYMTVNEKKNDNIG